MEPLLTTDRAELSASLGESHFREFKSALHGTPEKKTKRGLSEICRDIGSTLVAFANADGGELLVGVEDSGEVTGLEDFSALELGQLLSAPKTHVHPQTQLSSVAAAQTTIRSK